MTRSIIHAGVLSLAMLGAAGPALAAGAGYAGGTAYATPPAGSGRIYTEALNLMSAKGYHGLNLISQSGPVVHATAMTRTGQRVSLSVDTATGSVQQG